MADHDDHHHPVTTHAADTDAHAHAAAHHAERSDRHPAVIVALDESEASEAALDFALAHGRWGGDGGGDGDVGSDDLYLLSVLPPLSMAVSAPVAPLVTSVGVAAVARSWEEQRSLDERAAAALLRASAHKALAAGVARPNLHLHVLPAAGGASGVAASIAEFVRARHGSGDGKTKAGGGGGGVALVVVGSRGLGAAKAALMGALGLGSVSDYVLNHSPAPVAIVRGGAATGGGGAGAAAAAAPAPLVVLALDESPHSSAALSYAAERGLIRPGATRVRVVTSATPVPFPVLDETAAAAAIEAQSWADSNEQARQYALEVAERHARAAKNLLLRRAQAEKGAAATTAEDEAALDVQAVALKSAGGGTADAGGAVAAYAAAEKASLVVVGSRGMGALKAAVAGLVGLGSVSLYLSHHAPCPVVVVRGQGQQQQQAGGGAAAAPAGGGKKTGEGKQD